ncbi:interleukin-1 receptor-associated kinase 1 [Bombina bombina]|uniref:interleukin-1 receptor-associated kinase 1 n=1 Tax=Bombina bombina TaxID=8345 RepID=UPI00235A834E|nr:interleukin-1 receptor-associated kinase 1 [Bombina bombina]
MTMSSCHIKDLFLYNVPAPVMFRFYEIMDALDYADWNRFASKIILDLTSLRLLEQQNQGSRTQSVMWNWMNRNARVGELLSILESLRLLRALNVFQSWGLEYLHCDPAPQNPASSRLSSMPHCSLPSPAPEPRYQGEKEKTKEPAAESTQPSELPLPLPHPPPKSLCSSSYSSRTSSSEGSTGSSRSTVHSSVQESIVSSCDIDTSRQLKWSFQEIVQATNNFSRSMLIGEGGFGCVYKATMRHTEYAVKRLKQNSELEWNTVKKSFLTEIEKLTCVRHPNIIDLAGYCTEGEEYCLVYLYLPNGSLEDRLHSEGNFLPLSWEQRLGILQGAACGIQFLHSCQPSIIHGDIKSSNILLDHTLTPKLGDFGLARFSRYTGDGGKSRTVAQTTTVRGTLAYLPNEYVQLGKLTLALDTYSFGVVLLENLTGRKAIEEESTSHSVYLKDLVEKEKSQEANQTSTGQEQKKKCLLLVASRMCQQHLDERVGPCSRNVAQDLFLLACQCLERQKKRPSMVEVFNTLKSLHEVLRDSQLEQIKDLSVSQSSVSTHQERFPRMDDLMSSFLATPEENTYKFTPCENLVVLPNSRSVQPYNPPVSLYKGKLDSLCSAASSGKSLRTFRGNQNIPVESDESISDSCLNDSYLGMRDLSSPGSQQGDNSPQGGAIQYFNQLYRPQHLIAPGGHINHCNSLEGGIHSAASNSQVCLPHHQIVMNPAKQKLVEQVALYEQGKINSIELLSSGAIPGQQPESRGYPEESDDFPS